MSDDAAYLKRFLDPIRICRNYKPKFGQGNVELGLSLDQFLVLYRADPFYAWCGLDSDLMYAARTQSGADKTLSLDGRLEIAQIVDAATKQRVEKWMASYSRKIRADVPKNGVVFEVRQGYKSKDSKRQNADIDNIAVAWAQGYMPVFAIFSGQIDGDLTLRYKNSRGGILVGIESQDPEESLFAFSREVLGFDLAGFFKRHSDTIRKELNETLKALLSP